MNFYPENAVASRSTKHSNLEMCLQIIAGVRDPWTLTDDECGRLNCYACVGEDDAYDRLRRVDGLAEKAACAMAASLLISPWE